MGDDHLTARQRLLLTYLNCKHAIVSGTELAERLGVTTRTIRLVVSDLNARLKEGTVRVVSVPGRGYQLEVLDRAHFHELISERENLYTREDRIRFLLMRFIASDEWLDMDDLAESMYVSRTTLDNDLREIQSRISENEPYLMIHRRRNLLLIEDDEMKKRDILVRLYCNRWDYNSEKGIADRDDFLDVEIIHWAREVLLDLLVRYKVELDDYAVVYMKLAAAIIYGRNLEGHRLYNSVPAKRYGASWKIVSELLDGLSEKWELELEDADYEWLAASLERLRVLGFHQGDYVSVREKSDPCCVRAAEQMERELLENYALDFSDDEIFRTELLLNVTTFFNRQLSSQMQSQFSTDLMEKNYAMLSDAGRYLGERLRTLSGYQLREEEENFLVPMLASAAERKERRLRDQVTAGVVSHLNLSLTQYLCDNLNKLFGMRVRLIGSCPVHMRQELLEQKPKLLFTTVRLDEAFEKSGISCVVLSPGVTQEELLAVDRKLQEVERAVLFEPLPRPMERYLPEEAQLFIERKCAVSDVLAIIEENLRTAEALTPDVAVDYEKCRYAALDSKSIFVYTVSAAVPGTLLGEAVLRHPVSWRRQRQIRRVVLGVIAAGERRFLPALFAGLSES